MLHGIAIRLICCAREEDTVSRLGGPEFTIILENIIDDQETTIVAQRVIDHMAESFNYKGRDCQVSRQVSRKKQFSIFCEDV